MSHMEEPPPLPPESNSDEKPSAKQVMHDAWTSIRAVWTDPESGQKIALDSLGEKNALLAGTLLILATALGQLLLISLLFPQGREVIHPIRSFLLLLIPSISLAAAMLLAGSVFRSNRSYQAAVFVAGLIMLPTLLPTLGLYVFGFSNFEVIVCLLVTTACFINLLVYSSYKHVYSMSARLAFVLTPITVIVAAYLTSILVRMWGESLYAGIVRSF